MPFILGTLIWQDVSSKLMRKYGGYHVEREREKVINS